MLNRLQEEEGASAPPLLHAAGAYCVDDGEPPRPSACAAADLQAFHFPSLAGEAVWQAVENEKARISRDLHDDVLQSLFALKLEAAWLEGLAPGHPQRAREKLRLMAALIDATANSVRRIAAGLRPVQLEAGFEAALRALVTGFATDTGLHCRLETATPLQVDDACAAAAFRIVQEALQNVRKHARARKVRVCIQVTPSRLLVSVSDDGRGFSGTATRPDALGLNGMRERARLAGGEVTITSAPGAGTLVRARLPLRSAAAAIRPS